MVVNLVMTANIFEIIRQCEVVPPLVSLSSACAYPQDAPIPTPEEALWAGRPVEATGYYGIAKRVQVDMARAYFKQYGVNSTTLIPTNVYGPGEHSGARSHVTRAMVNKYLRAMGNGDPGVTFWGDGTPTRDFVYIDDLVTALLLAAQEQENAPGAWAYNIGGGIEISIKDLAALIGDLMGYRGEILWDTTRPNGQPRRCLDIKAAELALGWMPETTLGDGLRRLIEYVRGE
jgi:GDP-L-fucose synthase